MAIRDILTDPRLKVTLLLAARLLLALIFLHEGYLLARDYSGAVKVFAGMGVHEPLVSATIALQLGAGLSLALGLLTRLGALGLALFCIATAMLFHTNFADFNDFLHFEKDLAMAGGMLALVASGGGRFSLDHLVCRRWRKPD